MSFIWRDVLLLLLIPLFVGQHIDTTAAAEAGRELRRPGLGEVLPPAGARRHIPHPLFARLTILLIALARPQTVNLPG
jgi:hypothetical protein